MRQSGSNGTNAQSAITIGRQRRDPDAGPYGLTQRDHAVGVSEPCTLTAALRDRILMASDYPHFDLEYPGTVHELTERRDITKKQKEKILSHNAKAFLHI